MHNFVGTPPLFRYYGLPLKRLCSLLSTRLHTYSPKTINTLYIQHLLKNIVKYISIIGQKSLFPFSDTQPTYDKILIFSNLAPIFFEGFFVVIYITQPYDLALKQFLKELVC